MSQITANDDRRELKHFNAQTKQVEVLDADSRRVRFIASTGSEDRDGDIIEPTGIKLGPFLKNPVFLWQHFHMLEPIGRVAEASIDDGALVTDVDFLNPEDFADDDPHAKFADRIYRMYVTGFLNAVSIGFLPVRAESREDGGFVFQEVEMMELSGVVIQSNRDAIATDRNPEGRAANLDAAAMMKDVDSYALKSVGSFLDSISKEGRVLSAQNRNRLRNAQDNIQDVLDDAAIGEASAPAGDSKGASETKDDTGADDVIELADDTDTNSDDGERRESDSAPESSGDQTDGDEPDAEQDADETADAGSDQTGVDGDSQDGDDQGSLQDPADATDGNASEGEAGQTTDGAPGDSASNTNPQDGRSASLDALVSRVSEATTAIEQAAAAIATYADSVAGDKGHAEAPESKAVPEPVSFDLASRDTEWDSESAVANWREWIGATEAPTDDYASGFLYFDAEAPDDFDSYKLPYVDVLEGTVFIVPRAVFAAAAALEGARGGVDIPESDREILRERIEGLYERMREEFDDDSLVAPWRQENGLLTWAVRSGAPDNWIRRYVIGESRLEDDTITLIDESDDDDEIIELVD